MRDFITPSGGTFQLQDVSLRRNGQTVLDLPRLTLEAVGVTAILGPNGAGKSLLLRLLHGLIAPDYGQIRMDGAPLDRATRARQAMVFQRPVLLRRSVAGNLDFVLRRQGVARAARPARIQALLEEAGLGDKARQYARALSGGEAQRLAIQRAMATQPDVLFLDEPTASLDPAATQAAERLIRGAAASGCRVILVTHDLGQARRLADEAVLLHKGRVLEQAPAAAFFEQPQTRAGQHFVAGALLL